MLSPHEYREEEETEEVADEMNEMRERAGIQPKNIFKEQDKEIKAFKAMAGL